MELDVEVFVVNDLVGGLVLVVGTAGAGVAAGAARGAAAGRPPTAAGGAGGWT